MTQPDLSLGQLWAMIERDSQLTRQHVQATLDDVKERLDGFMTKELWETERRALVQRIEAAELELRAQAQRHEALKTKLEEDARAAREAARRQSSDQRHNRREFVYKGIIPALALLVAVISIIVAAK